MRWESIKYKRSERKLKKQKEKEKQHLWFAWYPVEIWHVGKMKYITVWMEYVLREGRKVNDKYIWSYRFILKEKGE